MVRVMGVVRVMGAITWTALQVSDDLGIEMMWYAIPVCLLLRFWIPLSVTWVMGQLAANEHGVLVFPRFHLICRAGGSAGAPDHRIGPATRVLVVIGNCLDGHPRCGRSSRSGSGRRGACRELPGRAARR